MAPNVAAGFIVFRNVAQTIEFLMLQTSYGLNHWTPPKGHVDPGESELQTAKRETEEEAGLTAKDYTIVPDFQVTLTYPVKSEPKTVYYWLASVADPEVKITLSEEHVDYRWANIEGAKELSNFPEMNKALDQAFQFLNSQK